MMPDMFMSGIYFKNYDFVYCLEFKGRRYMVDINGNILPLKLN